MQHGDRTTGCDYSHPRSSRRFSMIDFVGQFSVNTASSLHAAWSPLQPLKRQASHHRLAFVMNKQYLFPSARVCWAQDLAETHRVSWECTGSHSGNVPCWE